jgi:hypothetical protein
MGEKVVLVWCIRGQRYVDQTAHGREFYHYRGFCIDLSVGVSDLEATLDEIDRLRAPRRWQ